MKLVHGKSGRVLSGSLTTDRDGEIVLAVDGRVCGALEATEEGFVLIDATEGERQGLTEAGYALPSEVIQLRDEG
jgi:hypothetical protein